MNQGQTIRSQTRSNNDKVCTVECLQVQKQTFKIWQKIWQKTYNSATSEGQLISTCLFGVFNLSQKTNKNKSTYGIIVVKSTFFVRFLGESRIPKSQFEINWPFIFIQIRIKETVWTKISTFQSDFQSNINNFSC